jgi:hypothetical protein
MVFTKAGGLIFSLKDILAMKRGESSRLTVVSSTVKFSYFLEWQFYTMIQSDQRIMYSLDNALTIRNLTWTAPLMAYSFKEHLSKTSRHLVASNISLLREKIENTTVLANADHIPEYLGLNVSRKNFLDFTGLFSFITTLLTTLVIIIMCCYKRFKKQSRILQLVMATVKDEKHLKRQRKLDSRRFENPTSQASSNPHRQRSTRKISQPNDSDSEIAPSPVKSVENIPPIAPSNDEPKVSQANAPATHKVRVDAYGSD